MKELELDPIMTDNQQFFWRNLLLERAKLATTREQILPLASTERASRERERYGDVVWGYSTLGLEK